MTALRSLQRKHMRIRKAEEHMQTSLRGIAKRTLRYSMFLYEASNVEEPCAGKLHAGICEGAARKLAVLPRWFINIAYKERSKLCQLTVY